MKFCRSLLLTCVLMPIAMLPATGLCDTGPDLRRKAQTAYKDGNYKDALGLYRTVLQAPHVDPRHVQQDLHSVRNCLQNLGRIAELDTLLEDIAARHASNWRALQGVAQIYNGAPHWGTIIAGEFQRGHHRGGGRHVRCGERDRIRALQLMQQALGPAAAEPNTSTLSHFYLQFANMLLSARGGQHDSWQLQYLSDLTTLPDYEEGRHGGRDTGGAPVRPDGTPVFHKVPARFNTAATDGERWRWLLVQAMETDPRRTDEILFRFADFLHRQFGVQTMATYSRYFGRMQPDAETGDESGTYALHTLGEEETIAKLATGIKRFELPAEFNFIRIYQQIADNHKSGYARNAIEKLAAIFENRRQYPRAASYWRASIKQHGKRKTPTKRLGQIIDNWGQFEPTLVHPAGKQASIDYRSRNGTRVRFEAHEIRVSKLLNDIKDYLKGNPLKLDWQKLRLGDIGYRLVREKERRYIGDRVADWTLTLKPGSNHFDKRITVRTPLRKAGAYLLTATMANGNTSKIVVWLADTAIIRKPLSDGVYYFVADAVTGQPVPKANLEFFGYRQHSVKWEKLIGRHHNVVTEQFAEFTDPNGQLILQRHQQDHRLNWLITATNDEGRLAYLGFSGVWYGRRHDQQYNATKTFVITDRPVYRPGQPVKFKFWVRQAKYDQPDRSVFRKRQWMVRINNPKGEKVFEDTFQADEYGGFDGEFTLPDDAALGRYYIHIPHQGGGRFRVEEYKKPEFEVTVEAPAEPVMLGDRIPATIRAKYYFGAPVTKAKVTVKVLRSHHSANWYPSGAWDWFYGPGYWWFGYDYDWYPGWAAWGCRRPLAWWWPRRQDPPELVMENEVDIGPDGTVTIEIDTALAKEIHGDSDHRYEITAEVVDESRRTIVGKGRVLVARKPFKVYAWVDRGYYRVGDPIRAEFRAQTLDNKPVQGDGKLTLFQITYDAERNPIETAVQTWALPTDDEGTARLQMTASKPGQYRLAYDVTDAKDHTITGGYVFTVRGDNGNSKNFRFNHVELIPDKREYAPGEQVQLMVNTDAADTTVLLFIRPANGVYLAPQVIRMQGKSSLVDIPVTLKDMPNFFIEAVTVADGRVHTETREIVVPPEKRVLNIDVLPSAKAYEPGAPATVKLKLTDFYEEPFVGSLAITIYDKAVEYISGGSNVPEIKAFFWKWRRRHNTQQLSSLDIRFANFVLPGKDGMHNLGVFGHLVADEVPDDVVNGWAQGAARMRRSKGGARSLGADVLCMKSAGPLPGAPMREAEGMMADAEGAPGGEARAEADVVQPVVRTQFADTALWVGALTTDEHGIAEVALTMPENLTGWKIKTWAMGHGTKVGEAEAAIVTRKDLMLRMQAPRFFVQKDEVVLSANVHNYLPTEKAVTVRLELDGECLQSMQATERRIRIEPDGEERVNWRVRVMKEGEAVIRMLALADEESDAMEMRFPVLVHGMLKTESFSGVIRPEQEAATLTIRVPEERRIDESRLEIRYSPSLAGAMVDALPYLVEYPYGCTEQTLNRFVPTVIVQKILMELGLNLKDIRDKQSNLNAQEIGDDKERAQQWKRWDRSPVFDEDTVRDMVKQGLKRLTAMQLSDGGWGWFSGWGEQSYPHTTAVVVHGLQTARDNDVALVPGVLKKGVGWLRKYQAEQIRMIENAPAKKRPWKDKADNLDALIFMALTDENVTSRKMLAFLYRDRTALAVYGKAMFGMALHKLGEHDKLAMIMRNIEQYLVEDQENQSAWLNLPSSGYWWYWYGSEYEAHAYYLKLLARTEPKSTKAAGLVKYLLNNRKHATYWNSTRDTALCVEALADYLRASGEAKPDMTLGIYVDGKKKKEVDINADNLFSFDNRLIMTGDAVESGAHTIELRKRGVGPVYFNAYLTTFTLEDFITRAGLEVKVNRKVYKLEKIEKTIKVAGAHGQAVDQKVEKYRRTELDNLATLTSGDLVEIELTIESKNDYEYLVFEDMKAAGFEPVEVRSGYNANDMGAYMELRDQKVCFFVRTLARGTHSVAYRMRAEIPGIFSALPARAYAMYAPELKANSDEIKLHITD